MRALTYDGQNLWVVLGVDQPRGGLLRRSPNPLATDVGELSSIEALDLPGPGVDGIDSIGHLTNYGWPFWR